MNLDEVRKIAEILHTLFCGRTHELDMMKIEQTANCIFYLEQSIDRTWELPAHQEWLAQARFLIKISEPLNIQEVLQEMIRIYQVAEQFKKVNPKLLEFIKILIS